MAVFVSIKISRPQSIGRRRVEPRDDSSHRARTLRANSRCNRSPSNGESNQQQPMQLERIHDVAHDFLLHIACCNRHYDHQVSDPWQNPKQSIGRIRQDLFLNEQIRECESSS
jgi:hypothetical protein